MDADAVPVVIAAGHDVVMRVVRAACDAEGGIRIVGEVRDGRELLPACRSAAPRVVVIDDRLDDAPGLPTLRSLRDAGVSVAAVVLSDRTDGASILAAMQLGARGYLRRGALTGVGAAVRDVAAGRRAIDPALE